MLNLFSYKDKIILLSKYNSSSEVYLTNFKNKKEAIYSFLY